MIRNEILFVSIEIIFLRLRMMRVKVMLWLMQNVL